MAGIVQHIKSSFLKLWNTFFSSPLPLSLQTEILHVKFQPRDIFLVVQLQILTGVGYYKTADRHLAPTLLAGTTKGAKSVKTKQNKKPILCHFFT